MPSVSGVTTSEFPARLGVSAGERGGGGRRGETRGEEGEAVHETPPNTRAPSVQRKRVIY